MYALNKQPIHFYYRTKKKTSCGYLKNFILIYFLSWFGKNTYLSSEINLTLQIKSVESD